MGKKIYVCILLFFCVFWGSAQDFLISGGNTVSGMVCGSGAVYTWGYNYIKIGGTTFRTLGVGTTNNVESSPLIVSLPVGESVKMLDAGSGAFFLALTCTGNVLAWGDNQKSQLGNTNYPNSSGTRVVDVPIYVMAGATDATPTNNLSNVKYVSGGNNSAFAVLESGEVVAWGGNSGTCEGILGDGTNVDKTLPVYVKTDASTNLTDVVKVEAGDFTAYALVDTDGDGVGTVYSWGEGADKQLGQGSTSISLYASPVVFTDGSTLSNIVDVSAGDKACYAIDVNGFVWCWGDGSWDGLTGQGVEVDHAEPRRVLGGETGETYLRAKAIAAGQGYAMAVTLDNKAVSWGNNAVNGVGGALGDGTTTRSMLPIYIKTAASTPITDVANISDGDTWGFITKTDNTIWTWGYNGHGELGIGSTTSQLYAVEFTPPCTYADPIPKAVLPEDFCACNTFSYEIDPEFFNYDNNYLFTWYFDGVEISGATGSSYTATEHGLYSVEIEYIGSNAPCGGYDPASANLDISPTVPSYSLSNTEIDTDNDVMRFDYTGTGSYEIYTAETSGSLLNTFVGSGSMEIPLGSITENDGVNYTVYIEEVALDSGAVVSTAPATGSMEVTNSSMMFVAYKDIFLKSVDVYAESYSGSVFNDVSLKIMSSSVVSTGLIANKSDIVYSGDTTTIEFTNPGAIITIPVNLPLTGSTAGEVYWIGFGTAIPASTKIKYYTSASFPYADDIDGATIKIMQADENTVPAGAGEYGYFYNWQFLTTPQDCGFDQVLGSAAELPINLTKLEAHVSGTSCIVRWETESETDNDYFTVQVSTDGITYYDVSQILGAGTSTSTMQYSVEFDAPEHAVFYVRLQQTDFDGSITYSHVLPLKGNVAYFVVQSDKELRISLSQFNGDLPLRVELLDIRGAVVYANSFADVTPDFVTIPLSSSISKGVYVLKIKEDNIVFSTKIYVK